MCEPSIRAAVEADIPALVELGRAMHAESPRYSKLAYNAEKVAALAARIVPSGGALVAENNGILVGMMVGFVVAH